MRQVLLSKSTRRQTCWVPDRYATKGLHLRIRAEDGWKVETAWKVSLSDGYLRDLQQHSLRHHRDVTDI